MSDHELEAELQELQKRASETFPEANRVPAEVCVVHERAVWKSAQLQDESSKRSRTDNKAPGHVHDVVDDCDRGVLALATIALVVATLAE